LQLERGEVGSAGGPREKRIRGRRRGTENADKGAKYLDKPINSVDRGNYSKTEGEGR